MNEAETRAEHIDPALKAAGCWGVVDGSRILREYHITPGRIKGHGTRRPRILFLADRNLLANQAFNAFYAFPEDALVRIAPDEIRKEGSVPKNGSIFFTIFQTFMSVYGDTPYFGE